MPDDASIVKITQSDCLSNADDYTFYKESKQGSDNVEEQLQKWTRVSQRRFFSYDCVPDWPDGGPRLLACRSFQGRYWSVTGREKQKTGGGSRTDLGGTDKDFENSGYAPRFEKKDYEERYLFGVAHIVKMIATKLDLGNTRKQGLVVVSGATKAAKSLLSRGLVHWVLRQAAKKALDDYQGSAETEAKSTVRRPHLVTFEDPIEKWFWKGKGNQGVSIPDTSRLLDYTPRQRGTDAVSLREALQDALRQSPTVFYIGEIRRDKDWEPTIEFAGTGHLVVATAHAGSLTETVVRICRALKATTPAQRNYVADRLAGVVHMRLETKLLGDAVNEAVKESAVGEQGTERPNKALVGSLWMGTPSGVHTLTSGGFASLLWADGVGYEPTEDPEKFCLGESWWVRTQLKMLRESPESLWDFSGVDPAKFELALVRRLMHRHLETE